VLTFHDLRYALASPRSFFSLHYTLPQLAPLQQKRQLAICVLIRVKNLETLTTMSETRDLEQFAKALRSLIKAQTPDQKARSESKATAALTKLSEYPPAPLSAPSTLDLPDEDRAQLEEFRDVLRKLLAQPDLDEVAVETAFDKVKLFFEPSNDASGMRC